MTRKNKIFYTHLFEIFVGKTNLCNEQQIKNNLAMSESNCNIVSRYNLCFELSQLSSCKSCVYEDGNTICDGYTVVTCQMPPQYSTNTFDSDFPWISMSSQNTDMIVNKNLTFTSNRLFEVSTVEYSTDNYMNNLVFTTNHSFTNLTWTWISDPDYMYFNYPNMSIAQQPFGYPTLHPTSSPYDDDNDDAQCSDSPCPTNCPNGYTKGYTLNGCTVYCENTPINGQCLPGGSGCDSSCRDISIGAIIGIVVGGVVFIALICVGTWYCTCYKRQPLHAREENELSAIP